MSNDLSVNMRRAELERKSDERRFAWATFRGATQEKIDAFYVEMTEAVDAFAQANGYSREQMHRYIEPLGLPVFRIYYRHHSTTIEDGTGFSV